MISSAVSTIFSPRANAFDRADNRRRVRAILDSVQGLLDPNTNPIERVIGL